MDQFDPQHMQSEIAKKDMKIQALTERISKLTADYENQVADLRVEYTVLAQQMQQQMQQQVQPVESVEEQDE